MKCLRYNIRRCNVGRCNVHEPKFSALYVIRHQIYRFSKKEAFKKWVELKCNVLQNKMTRKAYSAWKGSNLYILIFENYHPPTIQKVELTNQPFICAYGIVSRFLLVSPSPLGILCLLNTLLFMRETWAGQFVTFLNPLLGQQCWKIMRDTNLRF